MISESRAMTSLDNPLDSLPTPSERRIALRVTPAAERALRAGHPWLFEAAIQTQSHAGQPGDLAVIFDRKGRFLAVGLYDPASPIRVRVLQAGRPATIDTAWFRAQIQAADAVRAPLRQTDTTGYRIIHGENDGLPGLVLDRYDDTLVLKLYTPAWIVHLRDLVSALATVLPAQRLVLRLSRAAQAREDSLHGLHDGLILRGPALDGPVLFQENGLRFEADPFHGQKTGFFLDQRENRARVEKLAGGRTVLNAFAYTGGFSLYAARGGARSVTSLDISRPALDAAARNFGLNLDHPAVAATRHEQIVGDAFDEPARLNAQRRRFDMVILDPPAFAKTEAEAARALGAYVRLTRLGVAVLRPGGVLVQASCSSRVDADAFFQAINRAAAEVARPLRESERTGHPLDHPVRFREGAYLKCLFATAE